MGGQGHRSPRRFVGPDGRAQLIRRHGGRSGPGIRVFRARLGEPSSLRTTVIDDLSELTDLADDDLAPYDGPLWLVCTNGRRDVCCAERGRPVAAALARRWPEATWETTHLGGHRFAATLMALPSAVTLGRLDPDSAVAACAALLEGTMELDVVRGVAGRPAIAQAAALHLRAQHGWTRLDDVAPVAHDGEHVTLRTPSGIRTVQVVAEAGPPARQSCGADKLKASPRYRVLDGGA